MYEFLYATRTVSVEHGQTQKYEKMAEIKQNILGYMPATLYCHGKPIEGDSRDSASISPIKAVNIIKRLMLSRRPKRTKAPIYGVEGRYRKFVSTQRGTSASAVGTVGVNLEHGRSQRSGGRENSFNSSRHERVTRLGPREDAGVQRVARFRAGEVALVLPRNDSVRVDTLGSAANHRL